VLSGIVARRCLAEADCMVDHRSSHWFSESDDRGHRLSVNTDHRLCAATLTRRHADVMRTQVVRHVVVRWRHALMDNNYMPIT